MESQLKRIKRAQALTWRAQLAANPFKANLCLPVCFVRCFNRRIVIDLRHVYLSTISNEFSRRILQISVKRLLHAFLKMQSFMARERVEPGTGKADFLRSRDLAMPPSRTRRLYRKEKYCKTTSVCTCLTFLAV